MQEDSTRDAHGRLIVQPGMVVQTCAYCGTQFADHASQKRRYHSNECKHAARRRLEKRVCETCGAEYEVVPSRKLKYHNEACYRSSRAKKAAERHATRATEDAARASERSLARATQIASIAVDQPTLPADVDVRSYLMGVFDGEGCITGGYDKRDGRYFLAVNVCIASEPIVKLFLSTWGGNCTPRAKASTGGLIMWDWRLVASRAHEFLTYAAERSLTKRRQAVLGLQLAENMAKYAWARENGHNPLKDGRVLTPDDHALRQRLVAEMRSLNGARSRFSADMLARLREPD